MIFCLAARGAGASAATTPKISPPAIARCSSLQLDFGNDREHALFGSVPHEIGITHVGMTGTVNPVLVGRMPGG